MKVRGGGLLEPPHLLQGQAEVVQGCALAVPVAGLQEDGGGGLVSSDRLSCIRHRPGPPCMLVNW